MPAGAQWEGIDLHSLTRASESQRGTHHRSVRAERLRRREPDRGAIDGGGHSRRRRSTAATTPPASSTTVTLPPASVAPSQGAKVDPADDLEIAPPYTLDPLSEQIAGVFVTAMEKAVTGPMADVVQFGFRTASKDGATQAWVIVMAFPGVPIGGSALLDQIVQSAMAGGGTVDGDQGRREGRPTDRSRAARHSCSWSSAMSS